MASGDEKENTADPPNVILTKNHRRYLRDDGDEYPKTDSARWAMYTRIRNRLRWGIYDFQLLYDNWDELNLGKAFEDQEFNHWQARKGIEGIFATLYRGLYSGKISFEVWLRQAVNKAEWDMHDRPTKVTFRVDGKPYHPTNRNEAAAKVTPDRVDQLRADEMQNVVVGLAHSGVDAPEIIRQGWRNRADERIE